MSPEIVRELRIDDRPPVLLALEALDHAYERHVQARVQRDGVTVFASAAEALWWIAAIDDQFNGGSPTKMGQPPTPYEKARDRAREDPVAPRPRGALGADGVWLTPSQRTPQADHGYDVRDYGNVDLLCGTLADVNALLSPRRMTLSSRCTAIEPRDARAMSNAAGPFCDLLEPIHRFH